MKIDPYIEAQKRIDAKNDAHEMSIIKSIGINAYNERVAQSNINLTYVSIPLIRYTANGPVVARLYE